MLTACGFHLCKALCQMSICTYFYYMFKGKTAVLLLIYFVNHTVHRPMIKIVKPYLAITAVTLREESTMLITYSACLVTSLLRTLSSVYQTFVSPEFSVVLMFGV